MQFILIRDEFHIHHTGGNLYVDGWEFISKTIEDTRRPHGVKISGETCIPEGSYKVACSMSNRFKKVMPMLYNRADGYTLDNEDIEFKGVRMHNGSTHEHTAGCILYTTEGADQKVIDLITEDAFNGVESWITIIDEVM